MSSDPINAPEEDVELVKFYQQENLIVEVTELISKLMATKKISKTRLAEKLNTGKSNVTQLLAGTANMTLRTISDILCALDSKLVVDAVALSSCGYVDYQPGSIWLEIESGVSELEEYEPGDVSPPHQHGPAVTTRGRALELRMVA